MEFSDEIREAARKHVEKFGHNELARRAEIDRGTLSRFVHGDRWLREKAMNRLAGVLGLGITTRRRKER